MHKNIDKVNTKYMKNYYKKSKREFINYIKNNPYTTKDEWDNYAKEKLLFSSFTLCCHIGADNFKELKKKIIKVVS